MYKDPILRLIAELKDERDNLLRQLQQTVARLRELEKLEAENERLRGILENVGILEEVEDAG